MVWLVYVAAWLGSPGVWLLIFGVWLLSLGVWLLSLAVWLDVWLLWLGVWLAVWLSLLWLGLTVCCRWLLSLGVWFVVWPVLAQPFVVFDRFLFVVALLATRLAWFTYLCLPPFVFCCFGCAVLAQVLCKGQRPLECSLSTCRCAATFRFLLAFGRQATCAAADPLHHHRRTEAHRCHLVPARAGLQAGALLGHQFWHARG